MAAPLILARTFKDAHAYAHDVLGLSIGHYRVVNNPGTLKAVRGTEIHLVEGWDKRPDRFSMKSAMRYCHNRIVDSAVQQRQVAALDRGMPTGLVAQIGSDTSNGDQMIAEGGPDFTDFFSTSGAMSPETPEPVATCVDCGLSPHADDCPAYVALVAEGDTLMVKATDETPEPETVSEPEPAADPEPAPESDAKPKARRRSKCKQCNTLHYKDEPCPEAE